MSKEVNLDQKYSIHNKAKQIKMFPNRGQQVPSFGQYPSVLQQNLSRKKLPIKNQNKYPNVQDNHSHSRSYEQISQQYQGNSFAHSEKSIQLHQRLKNLHVFYKNKIEEEKGQTTQRNNVFLGIIDQMQKSHQVKVAELRKLIEQSQGEKKDVGLVDQRMNQIKGSIDEILKQSSELKVSNENLQRKINAKEHVLREKQQELTKLKQELMDERTELQNFQRINLKQNKRNKEMIGMIDKANSSANQH